MTIGIVNPDVGIPWRAPSGAGEHFRAIAAAWARRSSTHVFVTSFCDHRGEDPEAPPDIPMTTLLPKRWPAAPRIIQRWLARSNAATFISTAEQQCEQIWLRHSRYSKPGRKYTFLEVNAPMSLEGHPADATAIATDELQAFQRADRIITVSSWLANWIVSKGIPTSRVRHIPNGADPLPKIERHEARAMLDIHGETWLVLGHQRPWHGLELLPTLLEGSPAATAIIIGTTTTLPAHPRIRAIGPLPRSTLAPWLAAADILVAPYSSETPPWFSPLKLFTARSAGLPIVSGAFGDIPALLADGSGIAVHTQRPGAWKDAIAAALTLPRVPRQRSWDDVLTEAIQ